MSPICMNNKLYDHSYALSVAVIYSKLLYSTSYIHGQLEFYTTIWKRLITIVWEKIHC